MKRNYLIIVLALLISLFIYLFYRTERTVITQLFISLASFDEFEKMRRNINAAFPLNGFMIYSLPEGLWVLCITLTSKSMFLKIGRREISLFFAPLLASIGLELFQLLELTQGRFDWVDIGASIFFWVIATYAVQAIPTRESILNPFTKRSFIFLASYGIVYLAHVWK